MGFDLISADMNGELLHKQTYLCGRGESITLQSTLEYERIGTCSVENAKQRRSDETRICLPRQRMLFPSIHADSVLLQKLLGFLHYGFSKSPAWTLSPNP